MPPVLLPPHTLQKLGKVSGESDAATGNSLLASAGSISVFAGFSDIAAASPSDGGAEFVDSATSGQPLVLKIVSVGLAKSVTSKCSDVEEAKSGDSAFTSTPSVPQLASCFVSNGLAENVSSSLNVEEAKLATSVLDSVTLPTSETQEPASSISSKPSKFSFCLDMHLKIKHAH